MKHAFVIPAYRESPFLADCIQSLLAQRLRSAVVVTTSTPSDFLSNICRQHGLSLLVNPHAFGIASDWNFALTATDADIVTLAHQDDLFLPDYLTKMVDAFRANPSAILAFTDHLEHTASGPRSTNINVLIKRWLSSRVFGAATYIDDANTKRGLLKWGNPISCPSVTIHRRLVPDFRFSDEYQINLDWDAWLRLALRRGGFLYLRERLVSHRVHNGTETTASILDRRRHVEDLSMFKRLWPTPFALLIHRMYRFSYRANET